tara:strand:+ start:494 stop:718 length:225 start_codon:yes stop_codon:yes gene_type:complete
MSIGGLKRMKIYVNFARTRRLKMSKIKNALWDWLEDYGYDLGFDWDNYPAIEDLNHIKINQITAKEYYDGKRTY